MNETEVLLMRQAALRTASLFLCMMLFLIPAAEAEQKLTEVPILDHAFTLLEEGNPFISRYNSIAGTDVRARMVLGMPYLWGGRLESYVFAKEPEYFVYTAWASSPAYYQKGLYYLYGFDCYGFVAWAWEKALGYSMDTMDVMFMNREEHIMDNITMPEPDFAQLEKILHPGDLLLVEHPGRHIGIYIGTLRMYGYTEEEAPELAGFLDEPLIVNSTVDAGDDGLCMKSGGNKADAPANGCEDIVIQDNTVYHAHGGFVIGSEFSGGMKNILVRNNTFQGTDAGLRFKSAVKRGGKTENIFIDTGFPADPFKDIGNADCFAECCDSTGFGRLPGACRKKFRSVWGFLSKQPAGYMLVVSLFRIVERSYFINVYVTVCLATFDELGFGLA